jgi:hypothetical protein
MKLADPIAKCLQDSVSFRHSSINLMRVRQVEAKSGLWEFFKKIAKFFSAPPNLFPSVHILNCNPAS